MGGGVAEEGDWCIGLHNCLTVLILPMMSHIKNLDDHNGDHRCFNNGVKIKF